VPVVGENARRKRTLAKRNLEIEILNEVATKQGPGASVQRTEGDALGLQTQVDDTVFDVQPSFDGRCIMDVYEVAIGRRLYL